MIEELGLEDPRKPERTRRRYVYVMIDEIISTSTVKESDTAIPIATFETVTAAVETLRWIRRLLKLTTPVHVALKGSSEVAELSLVKFPSVEDHRRLVVCRTEKHVRSATKSFYLAHHIIARLR